MLWIETVAEIGSLMPRLTAAERYAGPAEILWLKDAMELGSIPRKRISECLELDTTAVSKILNGTRKLKREEFQKLRNLIGDSATAPGKRLRRILALTAAPLERLSADTGIDLARVKELRAGSGEHASSEEIAAFAELFSLNLEAPRSDNKSATAIRQVFGLPRWIADHRRGGKIPGFDGVDAQLGHVPIYAGLRFLEDPFSVTRSGFFEDTLRPSEIRVLPAMDFILGGFGIRLDSDILLPRFERGEILLFQHDRTPELGKWVMVQDGLGRLAIGKLVAQEGEITLLERFDAPRLEVRLPPGHQPMISTLVGTWAA